MRVGMYWSMEARQRNHFLLYRAHGLGRDGDAVAPGINGEERAQFASEAPFGFATMLCQGLAQRTIIAASMPKSRNVGQNLTQNPGRFSVGFRDRVHFCFPSLEVVCLLINDGIPVEVPVSAPDLFFSPPRRAYRSKTIRPLRFLAVRSALP